MAALTKNRTTRRRDTRSFNDPVAAGVQIHAGALIVLNAAGFAEPATTATGLRVRGVAQHPSDNRTGADGAGAVDSLPGAHLFKNSGDITRADIGSNAHIVDDQTVSADGAGKSVAGLIDDVTSEGVWVVIP